MTAKVRMIVEFDLKEDAILEMELDSMTILNNVELKDNSVVGCFQIIEKIPCKDLAYNKFITNGKIIKKEIIN